MPLIRFSGERGRESWMPAINTITVQSKSEGGFIGGGFCLRL